MTKAAAAVAPGNEQPLCAFAKESAVGSAFGAALVAFCVDHPDAAGSDHEMIDVGPAAWDSPIVQHCHAFAL